MSYFNYSPTGASYAVLDNSGTGPLSSPPSSTISSSSAMVGSSPGYYPSSASSSTFMGGPPSYSANTAAAAVMMRSSPYVNSMSRPSSVSPTLGGKAYPAMSWRDRFEASRGFDLEDDMEFCPILCLQQTATPAAFVSPSNPDYYSTVPNQNSPLGSPSHQYSNPFAMGSSAHSSPNHNGVMNNNNILNAANGGVGVSGISSPGNSGVYSHNTITYYNNTPSTYSTPSRSTSNSSFQQPQLQQHQQAPKVRKAIQIIDPSTGLRVASPSLSPAGLAKNHRV